MRSNSPLIRLVILFALILNCGCKKDSEFIPRIDRYLGRCEFQFNGHLWVGGNGALHGSGSNIGTFRIGCDSLDSRSLISGSLSIGRFRYKTGIHFLNYYTFGLSPRDTTKSAIYFVRDEDVTLGVYNCTHFKDSSYINIIELDTISNRILYQIDVLLFLVERPSYGAWPDTVRITSDTIETAFAN